jgi:uncharacterized protein involved in tolerance to divalent cations
VPPQAIAACVSSAPDSSSGEFMAWKTSMLKAFEKPLVVRSASSNAAQRFAMVR